jgi:nucleoside-diphosphate-sugar epimerase
MDYYKILLTGATGLVGSALAKKLVADGAILTCPVRNIGKVKSMFDEDVVNKVKWIETSLEDYLANLDNSFDYVIHGASPTASKFFAEKPVETILFNTTTTTALLEFARKHPVRGLVFLSSLESYGTILDDSKAVTEDMQGYVNPMESRSSYNMAKRLCECLCHAYAEEYGVPAKVVRLTQTISPNIVSGDMRVFAQFARHAANGEDIELHTEGTSARQYLYIDDAVEAILCVLYKGLPGEAYNAAREDSYISVRDLAHFVQQNFNPQGKVVIQLRNDMGYAPVTKIRLSTEKLQGLGWKPRVGKKEMFERIISNLC